MNELLNIVQQTIKFYIQNKKVPTVEQLEIGNLGVLNQKGCIFITLYKNGEIRGSAGNVKEIEQSIIHETIKSTIDAISNDKRFTPVLENEIKDLKVRIDYIKERNVISEGKINTLDPLKSGVITISKDYDSLAVILPNISPKLLTGEDFKDILESKMKKEFDEKNYYVYEIKTDVVTNY
nr:AMMECR1 domain-containing protein [Candidatus Gracilibacteria bacterium]